MVLPFGFDGTLTLVLAAALIVAAFIRGYSGFGFSAVFIAFAAIYVNPLPLIPAVFACEIAMTAFQARDIRPHVDWGRAIALLVGTAIAIFPAVSLMARLDADTARLTVSGLILMLSLFLLSGWGIKRPVGRLGQLGVGGLSGIANSAGVGGLPAAAFLTAQPIPAPVFRATMIVFLTGVDLMTLPVMAANGLVTSDTAIAAMLAFPVLGIGVFLGSRSFHTTSPQKFRQMVVVLLVGLSILNIAKSLI